jgi:phage terminase large subunit
VREYDERAVPTKDRGNLVHRNGVLMFAPARRGYLRVWEKPRAEGRYVIWADTAEGKAVAARMQSFSDADADKGDRDFCSAHVFDVDRAAYVAVLHGRMAPEVFGEALYRLGFYYSSPVWKQRVGEREPAYMAVERNHSSGQTVISMLLDELEYPKSRFHRHRRLNKIKGTFTTSWGFVTDSDTRPTMLDDFARAIRERRVELPDRATINEMLTFVRNDAGRPAAMEGTHDDRVMSAAGCLAIAHLAPALPERPKPSPAPKKRRTSTPTGWEADYEVSVGT